MRIAGVIFVFLGCLFTLLCVYYRISFRESNRMQTNGFLRQTKFKRNVRHRFAFYHLYTEFTYAYTANGKQYTLTDHMSGTPNQLSHTVTIVYQKGKPSNAYIPNLTKPAYPTLSFGFLIFAVMYLALGIFFLIAARILSGN